MLNLHTHFNTLKAHLAQFELKHYFLFIIGAYFLVGMHYFQQNHGGMALNTPFNPIGWIAISMLVALGIIKIATSKKVLSNSFITSLTIGCLILLLPLLYAPSTGWYSHQRLLGLFAGLAVLITIIQLEFTKEDFDKLLKYILIAAFIESIFALMQFYVLPNQSIIDISAVRPSAIFFQANVAASFFVTGLVISLYFRQQLNQPTSKIYLLALNGVPVITTMAIVLLQSRTGFVAVVISSLLLLCNKHRANKQWLALVVIGITLAVASLSLLERHTRDTKIYSAPGLRSEIYKDSIELIKQQPLLGHGYGTFRRAYHQLQADKYRADPSYQPQYKMGHPHNEILLWLVEGGLVALLAIVIIGLAFGFSIWRQRRNWQVKLALVLPLALHTMTEFPFYSSVASWLTFLLITAFITLQPENKPTKTSQKQWQVRVDNPFLYKALACVLVVVTTVQMTSLLISHKIITNVLRNQTPVPLFGVSLPLVSVDFEQVLIETKLDIAIANNLTQEVDFYIEWARKQTAVMPIASYYRNLILAYTFRNKPNAANDILIEAENLFPSLEWETATDQIKISKQNQILTND